MIEEESHGTEGVQKPLGPYIRKSAFPGYLRCRLSAGIKQRKDVGFNSCKQGLGKPVGGGKVLKILGTRVLGIGAHPLSAIVHSIIFLRCLPHFNTKIYRLFTGPRRWRMNSIIAGITEIMIIAKITREKFRLTK